MGSEQDSVSCTQAESWGRGAEPMEVVLGGQPSVPELTQWLRPTSCLSCHFLHHFGARPGWAGHAETHARGGAGWVLPKGPASVQGHRLVLRAYCGPSFSPIPAVFPGPLVFGEPSSMAQWDGEPQPIAPPFPLCLAPVGVGSRQNRPVGFLVSSLSTGGREVLCHK